MFRCWFRRERCLPLPPVAPAWLLPLGAPLPLGNLAQRGQLAVTAATLAKAADLVLIPCGIGGQDAPLAQLPAERILCRLGESVAADRFTEPDLKPWTTPTARVNSAARAIYCRIADQLDA